jgi:hypothetical protein
LSTAAFKVSLSGKQYSGGGDVVGLDVLGLEDGLAVIRVAFLLSDGVDVASWDVLGLEDGLAGVGVALLL